MTVPDLCGRSSRTERRLRTGQTLKQPMSLIFRGPWTDAGSDGEAGGWGWQQTGELEQRRGGKPVSAWQVSAAVFGAQMLELLSTNEAADCELD